jgi:hypothetical protein
VYFSIVDHADGPGERELYTITVVQSFILDRTGIMIRGTSTRRPERWKAAAPTASPWSATA